MPNIKKKRKSRFTRNSVIVLTIALIGWLFVSLFVGSINTALTIDIQKMNTKLASLKQENQQLNIDIQTLQNKDRVYTIAKEAGLNQNQDNVVSVYEGVNVEAE